MDRIPINHPVCKLVSQARKQAGRLTVATSFQVSTEITCLARWLTRPAFVLSNFTGSNDGQIYIWDVNPPPGSKEAKGRPAPGTGCTIKPLKVLPGHKNSPSRVVRFNHRYGLFASSGIGEMAFWLPDTSDPSAGAVTAAGTAQS